MLIKRGVNMCGIEGYGLTTTATTGDVPLGVPYHFQYNTTADGTVEYSNCSCGAEKDATVYKSTICAGDPSCNYFSWWDGNCDLKTKANRGQIGLAERIDRGRCG